MSVQVSGGKVVLEETVPDRYMKHAIENICDAAAGVQDIENRARVRRVESYESTSTRVEGTSAGGSARRNAWEVEGPPGGFRLV